MWKACAKVEPIPLMVEEAGQSHHFLVNFMETFSSIHYIAISRISEGLGDFLDQHVLRDRKHLASSRKSEKFTAATEDPKVSSLLKQQPSIRQRLRLVREPTTRADSVGIPAGWCFCRFGFEESSRERDPRNIQKSARQQCHIQKLSQKK